MKKILFAILSVIIVIVLASWSKTGAGDNTLAEGEQPQVSADNQGNIRMVFGREDKIFCATSTDGGITFSAPVLVAQVENMHLGMSRGPQIASSDHYSIITAMDKAGNIHWFRLTSPSKTWKDMGTINNPQRSAPEGLMDIAADNADNFYAVWLDTRTGKKNQIYFSSLSKNANTWIKNKLVYQSPDGHVCECCKPGISVQGPRIAIMFRNWLNGSRDLYLLQSQNSGQSFNEARKLGMGTWKLNGCPMDGGGIVNNGPNDIETTWQREGQVYYCRPGQREINIGKGRTSSISGTGANTIIAMQNKGAVIVVKLNDRKEIEVGKGGFLKAIVLADNKILCVWEQDNKIKYKRI